MFYPINEGFEARVKAALLRRVQHYVPGAYAQQVIDSPKLQEIMVDCYLQGLSVRQTLDIVEEIV